MWENGDAARRAPSGPLPQRRICCRNAPGKAVFPGGMSADEGDGVCCSGKQLKRVGAWVGSARLCQGARVAGGRGRPLRAATGLHQEDRLLPAAARSTGAAAAGTAQTRRCERADQPWRQQRLGKGRSLR